MDVLLFTQADAGLPLAQRLRDGGHRVAVYGPGGDLDKPRLYTFVRHADLSVVDAPFPLEPTSHGSWRPSADAIFVEEVRRHHKALAVGPTPTIDLLVGDARYLRKWCGRLGITYSRTPAPPEADPWSSGAWFRERDVIPAGPYLSMWQPLFKSVRFRGWFELLGYIGATGPIVTACSAVWPPESIPEGREGDFLMELAK